MTIVIGDDCEGTNSKLEPKFPTPMGRSVRRLMARGSQSGAALNWGHIH